MAFVVRCPAADCRKFQLVEEADRGRAVACLICRRPVPVPAAPLPADGPSSTKIPRPAEDPEPDLPGGDEFDFAPPAS